MEISKSLIVPLLLLMAVLAIPAIGYFYIIPVYDEIKQLGAEKMENEETLFIKQQTVENIKNAKREFNLIGEKKNNKVFYILPKTSEFPNLIVQLEALAIENGMFFEDIIFEGKEGGDSESGNVKSAKKTVSYNSGKEKAEEEESSENSVKIEEILIDIKVSGSYESFMSYIKSVEENVRILDIDSIEFSSDYEEIIAEKEAEKAEEGDEEAVIIEVEELAPDDFDTFSFSIKMKTYWQE